MLCPPLFGILGGKDVPYRDLSYSELEVLGEELELNLKLAAKQEIDSETWRERSRDREIEKEK